VGFFVICFLKTLFTPSAYDVRVVYLRSFDLRLANEFEFHGSVLWISWLSLY